MVKKRLFDKCNALNSTLNAKACRNAMTSTSTYFGVGVYVRCISKYTSQNFHVG